MTDAAPPPASPPKTRRRARRAADEAAIAHAPPTPEELAFLASEFVMCTLPHSDPGDVLSWSRRNGQFTLSVQSGVDAKTGRAYGIPYGPLPRLLLAWITSEALRLGGPDLELGRTFGEFMEKLGLSTYTGGGVRGDAARLREQMRRLFYCLLSFEYQGANSRFSVRMLPVEGDFHFWQFYDDEEEREGFTSIHLGQRFYRAITDAAVPLDVRILRHVKHSPMALDLYAILVRESWYAAKTGKDRFLAWDWLKERAGADYGRVIDFRNAALPFVEQLVALCPRLFVTVERGGRGHRAGLVVSLHSEPIPAALPERLLLL